MKLADSIRLSVVIAACFALGQATRAAVAAQPTTDVDPAQEVQRADIKALRRAIEDLAATFGDRYPRGRDLLKQAAHYEKEVSTIESALRTGNTKIGPNASALAAKIEALRREALLANPLLDFDKLLLVRRRENHMGLPQNWQCNASLPPRGYDNQIAVLLPVRPGGKLTTLFQPENTAFVGDVDLHFNAEKMLFSMPNAKGRWQVYELRVDGGGLRQVSSDDPADVDNFNACYLPDRRIIFCSTRCFQGVPCVGGSDKAANLFIMDPDGTLVRQLTFDQVHDWCPTVLSSGRVLYARWEYSDTPHYFTRLLFSMNPDGTNQAGYYGSNSYWPNSMFYARPVPGHATKVVAVVSGHHGVPRMGELVVFDPALGRFEEQGVVQRIPGFGRKVEPIIRDRLVDDSWPKFLHPYPLSEKYFLVSCKPAPGANWGIYLVDTFDNFLLLAEEPGYALLEPLPLRKRPAPPAVPDRVNLLSEQAEVHISDIYSGAGMQGVPRGTVKKLRVYEPHFAYPGMGGHVNIGIDGPWDARRIWGTVPVDSDGSVNFMAPANTPLAVQPLDGDGRAVALMRSSFAAMPGEVVSCTGCHESQNRAPLGRPRLAVLRPPSQIEPWYGPPRGMSFRREVQPVLDRYCVGCHYGGKSDPPDLRVDGENRFRNFTPSYVALHRFVRRPGPESDYHVQKPMEWHAGTSELVQMLEKGHHNVRLDREGWDRLITWIDLNVPDRGAWHEQAGTAPVMQRRLEMHRLYANRTDDPEAIVPTIFEGAPFEGLQSNGSPVAFVAPAAQPPRDARPPRVSGWPFDAAEAARRQKAAKLPPRLKLEPTPGAAIELMLIPAGEFVMGSTRGADDEYPPARVRIAHPFYMSCTEVTNAQFAAFDAGHDSAFISMTGKDQTRRGHPVNGPGQPVVRVTWQQARDFCRWVAARSGRRADLPTEAQWEWAARAGTDTATYYGEATADFGRFANLADSSLGRMAAGDSPRWHPRIDAVDDGAMVATNVGRYQPNAWGLCDMIGNAAEWTRTAYRPYPYRGDDGRDDPAAAGAKVVRGGSWYDRPYRATASYRMHYQPWQHVFDVGFRIIVEVEEQVVTETGNATTGPGTMYPWSPVER